MFVEPKDNVVTTDRSYPTFNYHVNGYGGKLKKIPFKNDFENLDSLLKNLQNWVSKNCLCFKSNNPMGTFNKKAEMKKFITEVPRETLICLDEAYADFVSVEELIDIDINQENLIRMRTFQKLMGWQVLV